MSDLEKLLDHGDEFERSLLGAAVDEAEDREREARTLAALGLGGPGGPPPVPDGGGGALGGALGKGVVAAAIGGIAIAGAIALFPSDPDPVAAPSRPNPPAVVASTPEPKRAEPAASAEEAPVIPTNRRVVVRPLPSASAPVESDPSALKREIAALDRVRAALKSGDAKAARADLDRYDRDFPFGSLGPEAKALRVRVNKLEKK